MSFKIIKIIKIIITYDINYIKKLSYFFTFSMMFLDKFTYISIYTYDWTANDWTVKLYMKIFIVSMLYANDNKSKIHWKYFPMFVKLYLNNMNI